MVQGIKNSYTLYIQFIKLTTRFVKKIKMKVFNSECRRDLTDVIQGCLLFPL
jgi:hypothetical protein